MQIAKYMESVIYIMAGSSVFPTGGYANPTLTIIALSIRLADHVKATLNGKQYLKYESSLIDA